MFCKSLIPIAAALLSLSLAAGAAQPASATHPTPAAKPVATHPAAQSMAAAAKPAPTKAAANHCRDTQGKFVSCEKQAAPKRCRDAQGKFTACPK